MNLFILSFIGPLVFNILIRVGPTGVQQHPVTNPADVTVFLLFDFMTYKLLVIINVVHIKSAALPFSILRQVPPSTI